MRDLLLATAWMMVGCDAPYSGTGHTVSDRRALEAVVAECDRADPRPDCHRARRILAEARRDDRIATYRQGF